MFPLSPILHFFPWRQFHLSIFRPTGAATVITETYHTNLSSSDFSIVPNLFPCPTQPSNPVLLFLVMFPHHCATLYCGVCDDTLTQSRCVMRHVIHCHALSCTGGYLWFCKYYIKQLPCDQVYN